MPCQVSWQSVEIKPQPSVHGLGAEAAVAAVAPAGTTSAAQASTPQEAPPAAMITATAAVQSQLDVQPLVAFEAHVLLASPLVRAFSHRSRLDLSVDSAFRHGVPH